MAVLIDTSALTPEVAPQGIPQDYQSIQSSPDTFGAGLGRSMEQAGSAMGEAASFYSQVGADDLYNQFTAAGTKILHGDPSKTITGPDGNPMPDTGYMGLSGAAALKSRDQTLQQLEQLRQDMASKAQNPYQKFMFDQNSRRLFSMWENQAGEHADQQSKIYYGEVAKAGLDAGRNLISANPDNPDTVREGTTSMVKSAMNAATLSGLSPGDPAYEKMVNDAHRDALGAQISAVGVKDPQRALSLLESNRSLAGEEYPRWANELRSRASVKNGDDAAAMAMHEAAGGAGSAPAPLYPHDQASFSGPARAVGDSLAVGVGQVTGSSNALQGANPHQILDVLKGKDVTTPSGTIKGLGDADLKNGPIVLSSGASNDPNSAGLLTAQLATLKQRCVDLSRVTVLGVGNRQDFQRIGVNGTLQKIATESGAKFQPLDAGMIGPDGVHPIAQGYKAIASQIGSGAPGNVGGFGAALNRTLTEEGSALVTDVNGAAVKYGINKKANPDVDVAHLTREQAAAIYKERYWDKIDGDNLAKTNPSLAHVAFDTAVISGVERAKQFLAESGGDPKKFMALREQFETGLVARDPTTYSKYAQTWQNRRQHLLSDIGMPGGAPSSQDVQTAAPGANGLPIQNASYSPGGQGAAFTPATPGQVSGSGSPRSVMADAVRRVMERNDLTPEEQQHAVTKIQQTYAAAQMAAEEDSRSRRDASDTAMGDYVSQMIKGDAKGMLGQIADDKRLTPEAKENLVRFAREQGKGDDTSSYGPGFWPMYQRILKSADDPQRISDPNEILRSGGPDGSLTLSGAEKLIGVMNQTRKSTDDAAVHTTALGLINYAKSKLSFEQDTGPIKIRDPKGEEIFNAQFLPKFWSSYDSWMKQGKDPWQFLSRDNVDKLMDGMRDKRQMDSDRVSAIGEATGESPGGPHLPPPSVPTGVDPAQWGAVITRPPMQANGTSMSAPVWASVINRLRDNPTPQMIADFDRKFRDTNYRAKDILARLPGRKIEGEDKASSIDRAPPVAAPVPPPVAAPAATAPMFEGGGSYD